MHPIKKMLEPFLRKKEKSWNDRSLQPLFPTTLCIQEHTFFRVNPLRNLISTSRILSVIADIAEVIHSQVADTFDNPN
jgi:hypothetical protein